ncbi:MAG: Glucose-phosphate cytidylyltransferase [Actinomycetota bacterium]|jgi:glucose-1-phosphate cytidylyltransferase
MKSVILAGGQGTRLREETEYRPKPMVQIGGQPILWHIMKIFYSHGVNDFEIALGFKGDQIKEYFLNYSKLQGDIRIEFGDSGPSVLRNNREIERWNVGLNDTGLETPTGGRLYKLRDKLNETFLCTYGDGVADVNIGKLLDYHRSHGKVATVTAVHPSARFGSLEIDGSGQVSSFAEKPVSNQWVNGGFFVFETSIFEYLSDNSILERDPLETLAKNNQLMAWKHNGFWHPMDTIRDSQNLNNLWNNGEALWRTW